MTVIMAKKNHKNSECKVDHCWNDSLVIKTNSECAGGMKEEQIFQRNPTDKPAEL